MRKFVISGPACAGKTATINFISQQGFPVARESARDVIISQKQETGNCPSVNGNADDKIAFQMEVCRHQMEIEEEIGKSGLCFYDRGAYDSLAFLKMDRIAPPESLVEDISRFRYDAVFLFEILPVFRKDTARKERDLSEANRVYPFLREVYDSFGCPVVEVPNFSEDEGENIRMRWEFMRKHLEL